MTWRSRAGRRIIYRWRSAISGRFVPLDEALDDPAHTVRETVIVNDEPAPAVADLEDTESGVHHPPEDAA